MSASWSQRPRRRWWSWPPKIPARSCEPSVPGCAGPSAALGSAMATHKAVHVASANAPLTLVDVETTPPGPGHVRIAVAACGVCGTDHGFVTGGFPNMTWPLTLGHEIAGTIAELGDGVDGFAVGDRVAVGWFGGNCNRCIPCRKGKFMQCENGQVPSWHYPGGYAESVIAPGDRAGPHPRRTVIRRSGADGLRGRDDVQRAAQDQGRRRATGSRCWASAGWATSACSGRRRWASRRSRSPAARTRRPTPANWAPTTTSTRRPGRRRGVAGARRCVGGAGDGRQLGGDGADRRWPRRRRANWSSSASPPTRCRSRPLQLITPGLSVAGHPSGTSRDVEETMHFAVLSGVRAWIEERPLAEAAEAYAAMDEGRARYRMVLTM